jgi:hypothetical protein
VADTSEPDDTPKQDVYERQLAADLTANRRRQEELARLLERLKSEEKLLTRLQASIPDPEDPQATQPPAPAEPVQPESLHAEPAPAPAAPQEQEAAAVPPQRQEQAVTRPRDKKTAQAEPGAAKAKTTAKKTAAGTKAPARKTAVVKTADKPAAKKAAGKTTSKASTAAVTRNQPPLRELLTSVMGRRPGEPLKAGEIRDLLEAEYPGRATSTQIVRNTLEAMVAKATVERLKQKNSVMYTTPAAEPPAAASVSVEKVPATV